MTDNNKPEWFEIAENDGPSAPRKVSKTLPLAAVLVSALILGVGSLVAQTQEAPVANATSVTTPTSTPVATAATPVTAASPATPARLANPAIAMLPTNGENEDDEGYEDDEEGDDD
jgi:hypothetical protein